MSAPRLVRQWLPAIAVTVAVFLFNCLTITSVTQPATGSAGDTLAVSLSANDDSGFNNMDGYYGYFGVCLPTGWTVSNNSFSFTGQSADAFTYNATLTSQMEGIDPAPDGYYWWVGQNGINTNYSGSGTLYIVTNKTNIGSFSIDYMTGDQSDGLNYSRSNGHAVTISAPETDPPDNGLVLTAGVGTGSDVIVSWTPGAVDSADAYRVGVWYSEAAYPGGEDDTSAQLLGYYAMDDSVDTLDWLLEGSSYYFSATVCDSYSNWADTTAASCDTVAVPVANDAPQAGAGNALTFNGSDEYGEAAYAAALNPAAFTVSLWARVDGGQGSYRSPITSRTGGLTGYLIYAGDNNYWQFWTGNGSWHNMSGSAVVVGEWTHLAAVHDGTTKSFYVNGELVNSATVSYTQNTSAPLRIGAGATETTPQYYFNGAVDEVQVWDTAMSGDEIRAAMYRSLNGDETGLAGYWSVDWFRNGVLEDGTAGGNDFTLYNTDETNWNASLAWDDPAVREDDTLSLSYAYDEEGDSLTGTEIAAPANGVLVFDDASGAVTYVPDADFFGVDSFTYAAADPGSLADTLTVYVTVNNVNDAPSFTAGGDETVAEDAGACTTAAWATGMDAGVTNESGQALSFKAVTDNDGLFAVLPEIDGTTGDLTYEPAADANGAATVYVRLYDDGGTSFGGTDSSALDSFVITVNPVGDDAPVAGPDADYALELDAADERVLVSPVIDIGSEWTIETWFTYPLVATASWNTLSRGSNYDHHAIVQRSDMQLGMYDNAGSGGFRGTGYVISALADGWHHIAVVGVGGTQDFYIDGAYVGSSDRQGTDNVYSIGNYYNGAQAWSTLDEFRVWDRALTAAEVGDAMNHRAAADDGGLLAYYGCDTTAGTVLTDLTGNGYTGTLTSVAGDGWTGSGVPADPYGVSVLEGDTVAFGGGTDADGDSVTLTTFTAPAYGTLAYDNAAVTVSYAPDAEFFGNDTFAYVITDTTGLADTLTVAVLVVNVNDAPSFTAGANDTVTEDAGACTVAAWATGIDAGSPAESLQTLSFVLATDNDPLFAVLPAVDSVTGDLTYTPADYASGEADVYVYLQDDGGAYNGSDVSGTDTFTIVVTAQLDDPPVAGATDAGNALDLTGTNDYVRVSGLTDLSGSALTVEYWFRGTSLQSAVRQQNSGYVVSGWSNMHILSNDGGTGSGISVDGNGGSSATDGSWHHIAFTWQQNTVDGFVSYFDGKAVDMRTSADSPFPNTAADLYLGCYNGSSEFMSGNLDEVRIWSTARTSAEIRDNMYVPLTGNETGLVAYYRFDENTGTDLPDASPNGWDGILYNTDDTDWGASAAWDAPLLLEGDSLTVAAGYDPDGDSVTAAELVAPGHGSVTFNNAVPSMKYVPVPDFAGTDSFTFVLTDTTGLSDTATYVLTVTEVNDVPVFTAGANDTVTEDAGPCTTLAWATGLDAGSVYESAQALSFVLVTDNDPLFSASPAVDGATGDLSYTPAADAYGEALVYVRLYDDGGTAYDGVDSSALDSFVIVVTNVVDDPPVAGAGNALELDGTDDYTQTPVDIQASALSEVTLEAWIRPDRINHTDWQGILSTDDGGWDRGFWVTSGSNTYSVGCGAQWIPGVTVTAGEWHHVALVYSASDVLFYYDGVEYSRGSADGSGTTAYNLKIGAGNGIAQFFQGGIDEVRVWDGVRTADEITDNMFTYLDGDESGLLAYYRCDRTTGADLPDLSVNGNHTAMVNTDDGVWAASGAWSGAFCAEDDTLRMSAGYDDGDTVVITPLTPPANGTLSTDDAAALLTYVPGADFHGADTFTVAVNDTNGMADTMTVAVTVSPVNDAPVFTAGTADTVLEDAGACTLAAWASGMYAGAVDESTQTLVFGLSAVSGGLFAVQPAVDAASGDLTYEPAADANGESKVYIRLYDDGGTSYGGVDSSALDSFVIVVTPVNDDPPVAGPVDGNALELDGTDDYATASPAVPTGSDVYTIEAWIRPAAMGTYGIIGWGNYGTINQCNALRLSATGIVNYWWSNDLTVTTGDISGAWHHVAAVWDGTTRSIYLDGVLAGSDTPSVPAVASAANFGVGVTNSAEYFNGALDEVRVWDTARSAAEIKAAMYAQVTGSSGLAAYYRCDASSGFTLTDLAAGAHGTLYNTDDSDWIASGAWDMPLVIAEDDTVTFAAGYHPDGDSLIPALLSVPANGTALIDTPTALATYLPDADFYGTDSFMVAVSDTNGLADTAWMVVTVTPVNDAPYVASPASDVSFDEGCGDTSIDLSAVFADVDDTLAYSYYLPEQSLEGIFFSDGFETGTLDAAYWSAVSGSNGRIQVSTSVPDNGVYGVLMDAVTNGTYALNELVLTLDLTGRRNVGLSFAVADYGDEDNAMSASFTGSENSDGVAISADGTTWYRLISLTGSNISSTYQTHTVDLDAAVAAAGISYNSSFMIKFQQYDNYAYNTDGISFDEVVVTCASDSTRNIDIAIGTDGTVAITGQPGYSGTETVVFTATDTSGLSVSDTVDVTVNAVDDMPVAVTDTYLVSEDETLTVAASGLLINDEDPDDLSDGLMAYWSVDAATVSGTDVTDLSGNGYDAVLSGGVSADTGMLGDGITLDGVDGYMYSSINIPETDFTVAFWFKSTLATTGMFSVRQGAHGGANDRGIYLTGGYVAQRVYSTETIQSADGGFNDGAWHHCAMVVAYGVGQRLYVDGTLQASGSKDESDFDWDDRVEFGYASEVSPALFTGSLDDMAIWDEPLSAGHIARLYDGGAGREAKTALNAALLTDATNGTATVAADGAFSYVPDADYNGPDTVTYTVADKEGGLDTGLVVITVNAVADPVTITSAAVDTAQELEAYAYVVTLDDIDGDAVISLEGAPGWMSLIGDTAGGMVPYVYERDTMFTVIASNGTYADTVVVTLAIRDTNGVVPVEMASFTASVAGASVLLAWTTVSEQDNLGFNILRDNGSGEAVKVNTELIKGAGTTVETRYYSFVDNGVAAGTWYYRIQQVDLSGNTTVSAPVQVVVGTTDINDQLTVVQGSELPDNAVLFRLNGQTVPNRYGAETGIYLVRDGSRLYRVILVK